jgi:hypothetical protein
LYYKIISLWAVQKEAIGQRLTVKALPKAIIVFYIMQFLALKCAKNCIKSDFGAFGGG